MHTDTMHRMGQIWHLNRAVQKPALIETVVSHILIVLSQYRVARKNRVAMMTVIVGHILAISMIAPKLLSEKMMLRLIGPVSVLLRVFEMLALDFLKKDDVSIE